jgi:hypothetical protein
MICIQVSGDFQESAFRENARNASLLVNQFIEYIKSFGYRHIVRDGKVVEAYKPDGSGYCRIESSSNAPKGVKL